METRVKFLDWQPDAEDTAHAGLTVCQDVIPDSEGYKEFRSGNTSSTLVAWNFYSEWLDMRAVGYDSGNYIYITHDRSLNSLKIGSIDITSVDVQTDGTQGSLLYSAAATGFATSGGVVSFSTCELDDSGVVTSKYYFGVTAGGVQTALSAGYISYVNGIFSTISYTNLPNSASGIVCGTINQFAVVGNDQTGDPIPDYMSVRWSAIGDATDWPTPGTDDARSKQSGKQTLLPVYGEVTGISGDDFFGYVFQESAITKMTYVGGDVVFSFDTFEEVRGCGYYERFIRVDDSIYYESKFGRHVLKDGQVIDIGYGRVDDSYPPTEGYFKLRRNTELGIIFFSNFLLYNYKTDQWSRVGNISPVVSIDDADAVTTNFSASGTRTFVYDTNGGNARDATITTAAADLNKGGRTIVNGVRPLVNGSGALVRVGVQDNITDSVTWSSQKTLNTRTGYANMRMEGRYVRVEVVVDNDNGFNTILGADIDWSPAGKV